MEFCGTFNLAEESVTQSLWYSVFYDKLVDTRTLYGWAL